MIQKSFKNNKSTLFLVSTPIGNLDDITLRAIKTLKEVDVVFAEDTRTTKTLLNNYEIKKKIYSCHKFNEKEATKRIISFLDNEKNVALVTDRGTPIISDPGGISAKEVIDSGYNVVAIPGVTAFVAALTTSGLDVKNFLFYGFLNHKESINHKELIKLKEKDTIIVLYESPHRLIKTLNNIEKVFGNIEIIISREITKYNEEIFRGKINEAINEYKDVKGEIVIILKPEKTQLNYHKLLEEVDNLLKKGFSKKDAIKTVAEEHNISKNILYNQVQKEGEL